MNSYFVTWTIEIDADSPREAAELAREHQTREGTSAVVFDVTDEDGETVRVDLLDDDPDEGTIAYGGWDHDGADQECKP